MFCTDKKYSFNDGECVVVVVVVVVLLTIDNANSLRKQFTSFYAVSVQQQQQQISFLRAPRLAHYSQFMAVLQSSRTHAGPKSLRLTWALKAGVTEFQRIYFRYFVLPLYLSRKYLKHNLKTKFLECNILLASKM